MRNPRGVTPRASAEHLIPNTTIKMMKRAAMHDFVPHKRPFIFDQKQVRDLSIGVKLKHNIMLTGPTGCGKTSVVTALAHELNHPLVRFNCNGETRVSNLVGMMKPTSDQGVLTLTFSPGDLAVAMKEGFWVVFDEIDAALPSVLFVLQSVLEEGNRSLHIPETKETVEAHPDFQIFATGNTIGYRSSLRSKHAGTQPLNTAFVDRFGMVIACDYPERIDEIARVSSHLKNPDADGMLDYVDGVCRVAEALRRDEKFRSDFSTRRLIQWALLIEEYLHVEDIDPILYTFDLAVGRKLDNPLDAKVAAEVVRRINGFEANDKAV